jgi:hypothetical protein
MTGIQLSAELSEHFQAKWSPVRVKKMRQNKTSELFSGSVETENALGRLRAKPAPAGNQHPEAAQPSGEAFTWRR